MEQQISELTMLLIFLTGWEETSERSTKGKKVFKAFRGYRYEEMKELENQGLIRPTYGGKFITVTEKGKQTGVELKKRLLDKTKDQTLKGLDIKPWTKSLLPCHIPKDDKTYAQYLEMIELMRMPEIEKLIMEKLAELKISAAGTIKKFFEGKK